MKSLLVKSDDDKCKIQSSWANKSFKNTQRTDNPTAFDYEKNLEHYTELMENILEERTTNNYSYCKGKSRGSRITTYTHL